MALRTHGGTTASGLHRKQNGDVRAERQDRYGRRVAVCAVGGEDLGAWLVEHGWALAYAQYSGAYAERQKRAECGQVGIWQSRFQKPWEWRKQKRKKPAKIPPSGTLEDALERLWRAL